VITWPTQQECEELGREEYDQAKINRCDVEIDQAKNVINEITFWNTNGKRNTSG
jgi:hypothetical protein